MLLEEKLLEIGTLDDDKKKMCQRWNVIKSDIVEKLSTVCVYFPHFSLHNESHSKTISIQIGRLLGNDRINKLSFTDIFMMLLCFYMHDIGMAVRYEEINNEFQSTDFKEYMYKLTTDPKSDLHDVAKRLSSIGGKLSALEYDKSIDVYNDVILIIEDIYRKNHAKRSANEIKLRMNLEKDIGVRFVEILAEMCEIHQKDITNIMNLPYKSNGLFDDYMHPRFIASMLCLGDLLDLDTDRFNYTMLEAVSPLPQNSKLHLEKHKSIRQFLVEPKGIEIISNCSNINVYRIMREWTDWIEQMCIFLATNWSEIAPEEYGIAPHINKCELLLNNNKKWLQFSNMKFNISSKRALDILKGSRIYRNKFICIREIMQNAIDATLLRMFQEKITKVTEEDIFEELISLNWHEYSIEGKVYLNNRNEIEVEIRDYGYGISEEDIKQIASVSNKKSEEKNNIINKMPVWLRPSGAFGIGLQSIFLLTDKFEIITKTREEKTKKIVFESVQELNGYITIEDFDEIFPQGTLVSFTIDCSKIEINDLDCPEYFYKTEAKEFFVLEKINQIYNNMLIGTPPIYRMVNQKSDYVPIKIKIMNPVDKSFLDMLNYETIFNKDINFIKIDNCEIKYGKFLIDKLCQIFCNIILTSNKEHKYGEIKNMYLYSYGNTVFYRNVYVKSSVIEQFFMSNRALYPYVDLKINLLDKDADSALELNRNAIRENYESNFIQIVEDSVIIAIKEIIDSLINKIGNSNIGDCIFILYQFSTQYNYKQDMIESVYKEDLKNIIFNNYYNWNTKQEVEFTFNELKYNHLYFVLEEVNSEDIENCNYPNLDDKSNYILCLEKENNYKSDVHILNHRVLKMFVGTFQGKLLKVLEAKPFECNSNSIICDKDDLFFLEDIIDMIIRGSRCINSLKQFEILITPLKSKSGIIKYGSIESRSMIEMPFDQDILKEMKKELSEKNYIINAKERYYNIVIGSNKFAKNINYIQTYKDEKSSMIEEKYKELVIKVLELLSDINYIKYTKNYIEWCNEHNNFRIGKYEKIEHNKYVTLSS